jgi:hypothetical protein
MVPSSSCSYTLTRPLTGDKPDRRVVLVLELLLVRGLLVSFLLKICNWHAHQGLPTRDRQRPAAARSSIQIMNPDSAAQALEGRHNANFDRDFDA